MLKCKHVTKPKNRIKYTTTYSSTLFYVFKQETLDYNSLNKHDKMREFPPEEPLYQTHFIPANSSSSAFLKSLQSNNNCGIIFETEADVLSGTFKQEWGGFSHLLRDAFHHETASMNRNKGTLN